MVIAFQASQVQTIRATSGRDVFAGQPVRIAVPVPVLVARADEWTDVAEQSTGALEHLLAEDRVGVHQGALLVVEWARLVNDR